MSTSTKDSSSPLAINELDSDAARYAAELLALLFEQLRKVIELREPDILPFIQKQKPMTAANARQAEVILQAWGIWFQLLNIAEENAGMRRRRQTENLLGLDKVPGTFAHVFAEASQAGVSASVIQDLRASAKT